MEHSLVDVVGLDVEVRDSVRVQELEPLADVPHDGPDGLLLELLPVRTELLQYPRKAASRAEVHLYVKVAALLPGAELPHHVGVRGKRRHGQDLPHAPEARSQRCQLREARRERRGEGGTIGPEQKRSATPSTSPSPGSPPHLSRSALFWNSRRVFLIAYMSPRVLWRTAQTSLSLLQPRDRRKSKWFCRDKWWRWVGLGTR